MKTRRSKNCAGSEVQNASRGFTLIDTLVTLAIVALLISILLPSLSGAREAARRVACASNVRQIGLGITMYADDHSDRLPPSVFAPDGSSAESQGESNPAEMMTMRLAQTLEDANKPAPWDGIGLLFATEYLPAARLFYCPSHHGDHPYQRYSAAWMNPGIERIVSNYHYRGMGPNDQFYMSQIDPTTTILLTDGMRLVSDYNHRKGSNAFRADNAVIWVSDPSGVLANIMARNDIEASDRDKLPRQWNYLETGQDEAIGEPPR